MEQVMSETVNGKRIATYLSEPSIVSKEIVIMNHGFRGTSIGPARQFVDFQRLLNNNGYSVLRFDQPNSGNSEGDYIESSFDEWVNTTVHFASSYLSKGYKVALLGQSMGATTTVVATNTMSLRDQISCILLWVPDAKSMTNVDPTEEFEEGGQRYLGKFWMEAKRADFFSCLNNYSGGVHLVYGEHDKYVHREIINETSRIVKEKGHTVTILAGEDHSPWSYDNARKVYQEELAILKKYLR